MPSEPSAQSPAPRPGGRACEATRKGGGVTEINGRRRSTRGSILVGAAALLLTGALLAGCGGGGDAPTTTTTGRTSGTTSDQAGYPWHTGIVATTFWVGEVFDPNAADGSQMFSTYDAEWSRTTAAATASTTAGLPDRAADRGQRFFPTRDDAAGEPVLPRPALRRRQRPRGLRRSRRGRALGRRRGLRGAREDPTRQLLHEEPVGADPPRTATCYGQIQDAVRVSTTTRIMSSATTTDGPQNQRYNGAGMDVARPSTAASDSPTSTARTIGSTGGSSSSTTSRTGLGARW